MRSFFKKKRSSDPRFVKARPSFVPAYLKLYERDKNALQKRIEKFQKKLEACDICPRMCEVNRLKGEAGICNTGEKAQVSSVFPHLGEEAVIRGRCGSGTLFFSFCNLKCVFCQNYELSWQGMGESVSASELADLMVGLQKQGCHNINFVTPSHVVPQIAEALPYAIEKGLRIPLVYNSSGYDKVETIALLEDIFDIYMPDFKFWDVERSNLYMKAPDYREMACAAIKEMQRQVGSLVIDEDGVALRGLLVRHLVMPQSESDMKNIFHFLADEVSTDTWINIMAQYSPAGKVFQNPEKYGDICRSVASEEMREAFLIAEEAGLHRFDKRYDDFLM